MRLKLIEMWLRLIWPTASRSPIAIAASISAISRRKTATSSGRLSRVTDFSQMRVVEISERLYDLTTRIWLKSVTRLNLPDEVAVFRREMGEILAAMEIGDLEAVGHIRRSHISMSFNRMRLYPAARRESELPQDA